MNSSEARSSPADDSPRAPACLVITPGTASTARALPLQVPGRRASRDAGAGRRRACPRGAGSRGHALREAPGGLVISAGALAARLGRGGRRAERPAAQQVARGCSARAVARGARRGALFRRGSAGSACRRGCCAWQQPLRGGRRRPRSQRGGGGRLLPGGAARAASAPLAWREARARGPCREARRPQPPRWLRGRRLRRRLGGKVRLVRVVRFGAANV